MSISVSDLAFEYPGEPELFFDVSFRVGPGEHWAILGENGAGKSTLLRIVGGLLDASAGSTQVVGDFLYLPQDIGFSSDESLRSTLLKLAPPDVREVGERLAEVEARLNAGDEDAPMEIGQAIADWAGVQGYQLEGKWDASVRRIAGVSIEEAMSRPTSSFSGGERKQIVLDLMLTSDASVLLLDEPDNYMDIPAKAWLESKIRECGKTVLAVSHDRKFLDAAFDKVVTLEGSGAWVHGGRYATYEAERDARQARMGDAVQRWKDEERRLFQHMKVMKQRAAVNPSNAPKANAAETRLERFRATGPPPAPVVRRPMQARLVGGDAARTALAIHDLKVAGVSIAPFSDVVRRSDRIGLIGSNGSGKSHILRTLAGEAAPLSGRVELGDRTIVGSFTQINDRPEFVGRDVGQIVESSAGAFEPAMRFLARYGMEQAYRRPYLTLSGGQRARLEILQLELDGSNLLLLDEPTDNLDVESAAALERALNDFDGASISVSHDRTYLETMDRYWFLSVEGNVFELLDWDDALKALLNERVPSNGRLLSKADGDA